MGMLHVGATIVFAIANIVASNQQCTMNSNPSITHVNVSAGCVGTGVWLHERENTCWHQQSRHLCSARYHQYSRTRVTNVEGCAKATWRHGNDLTSMWGRYANKCTHVLTVHHASLTHAKHTTSCNNKQGIKTNIQLLQMQTSHACKCNIKTQGRASQNAKQWTVIRFN